MGISGCCAAPPPNGLDYHEFMSFNAIVRCLLCPVFFVVLSSAAWTQVRSAGGEPGSNNSPLDSELFYQLLLGELNARSGTPSLGYSLMLDAARKTQDEALYRRAVELAIQARQGEPALTAARAWRQVKPQSRQAHRHVLQVLLALGRIADSSEPLRSELALTPRTERAAFITLIPRLYARVADKKLAASTVEPVLVDSLSHPDTVAAAWSTIGRLRLASGDTAGALEAAKNGHQADAAALGPVLLALENLESRHPGAEDIVKRYLSSANPEVEIRMGYIHYLLDAQRHAQASTQVQLITRNKPDFTEAWLIQGNLALQDNQIDRADEALKRYLHLMSDLPKSEEKDRGLTQAYLSLAQIAEKRSDYSLAESWLEKIDNPQALISMQNRRASMLAKQGKHSQALELIRKLPERSGEQGEQDRRSKLLSEVNLLRENRQYTLAYDLLSSAITKQPQEVELLYEKSLIAEKLERFEEMESLLRRAIEIKPDFHHAYNALGYSLADRRIRLGEARDFIKKALEFAPDDPYITDSLGWVEYRLGNLTKATELLEIAYKTKPDAEIAAHLGELYWVRGQPEKARAIWHEGLMLNRDSSTLQQTLKRLSVPL